MIPDETRIARVMRDTGMHRLQAIRHLQMRDALLRQQQAARRAVRT